MALPLAHELHFDQIHYGLVGATEEGIINVYDSNNYIGGLFLVKKDACFRFKVLEPKFFEGLIECAPPSYAGLFEAIEGTPEVEHFALLPGDSKDQEKLLMP